MKAKSKPKNSLNFVISKNKKKINKMKLNTINESVNNNKEIKMNDLQAISLETFQEQLKYLPKDTKVLNCIILHNTPKKEVIDEKKLVQRVQPTQVDEEDKIAPELFNLDDIQKILQKNKYNLNEFFQKINVENKMEDFKEDLQLAEKKKKRPFSEYEYGFIYELMDDKNGNKNKKIVFDLNKRGRKTNNIQKEGIHDKMHSDNIIKKLKAKLFDYALNFLNNIISKGNGEYEKKLLKLDYKYINRLNREQDLKFLNMSLKNLFSKEISGKYSTKLKDFNKKYIKYILEKGKDDDTISFVFKKMTFGDWLNIFTHKKSVIELITEYDCLDKKIDIERIEKSIYGVDELLYKIMDKNDEEYLTPFIFLLYNYERWFYVKKGRNRGKKTRAKSLIK